ncbi:P-loop containing nucleoside triphosphate hydrolase protein [Suillus placidus]|uniref:DNA repair protein RAD50 n=1 Tax=Suillus placidus TaxID=48579 RepID=A0A9P6ZH83_9AGAM|nr:P-loop containing nucleoside triphosphate hydrolase protein [Suillus placidus]
MASLDKLAIRGIRSFDDKQISVIEFFSPVTVIVGHNGSGKTTVIECLKYATTGDQPPNTRGGAFIHDPKMANEKEVKAQVKLRFHAANGTRMLVVRNLSVTVKKTGLTMKTLENILALADSNIEKGGKRGAISTKCAEIDTEIPHLLGVSKSVLENVIFCHQEDSYWPLAEPSALKKKFDDIFEATRYSKALDSIKSLRKDRVSDLKADKERLESLAKEKTHADKLRGRISDLNATITGKQFQYEETKKRYEELVKNNARFYESATQFRELYVKVENLQQKKEHYRQELSEAKESVQEVGVHIGTDEELQERLSNFGQNIEKEKIARNRYEVERQDLEDELAKARRSHVELINEHGELAAEAKAHDRRISEREELIRDISDKNNIKGYNHTPLEREKVVEFVSRLGDLQRRQRSEFDKFQKERQAAITKAESSIDTMQGLASELRTLAGDVEEKKLRLEKIKADMQSGNFDERLNAKAAKARSMEDQRDTLNTELRGLSLQAESRARLDLKRAEVRSKTSDTKNILELCNVKFRKLIGRDARAETMERDIDRVSREKDEELTGAEAEAAAANKELQQAETTLSHAKSEMKSKRDELKSKHSRLLKRQLEKQLKDEIEGGVSLEIAISFAERELEMRKDESKAGVSQVYEQILKAGQAKKRCTACNRGLHDNEMAGFEKYVCVTRLKEQIKNHSPEAVEAQKAEVSQWETDLKKDIREIASLKQSASTVSRNQNETERLKSDIKNLETELAATGTAKTGDDVQKELDVLSNEIRSNERERQALMTERDHQNQLLRTNENDLHAMEKKESTLSNQIRDKDIMEERIVTMTNEIATLHSKLKELESKISEAQAPIDMLEQEHQQAMVDLDARIREAQRSVQELNTNVDKLDNLNKIVERYIREKRAHLLVECADNIEQFEQDIKDLVTNIENARDAIAKIDREISESGSLMANLHGNIRIRKLSRDIAATQAEIDSCDMEGAAKAKRNFEDRYQVEKQRETEMQSKYAHIGGEISSHQEQLKMTEKDLRDFKDINKRYTDQLVKVKMSDMANNDLEKYAKALDNAIMKYHGLKMEEVNDTMRHLWNKTYQGTDIDGIKIRSDVEGGASKRSYNYRVVMTKDQVEMDMRGRCSAGQKMLASIIIRLALSDSFGQNCGILALDEPTNALDVENIDALAESLVDIINERKNHSNFQLIIITHDENFLRKLGQAEVVSLWSSLCLFTCDRRVSRDSRQKSVIERQRFR